MRINRRAFVISSLALGPILSAQTRDATLVVQVRYNGPGTVDASHKIYVSLWDTPDFTKSDHFHPVETKPAVAKSGSVQFTKIKKNPVYVSFAYDPSGHYDGQTSPPTSAVSGVYQDPGEPKIPRPIPLNPGQTQTITITIDELNKTP